MSGPKTLQNCDLEPTYLSEIDFVGEPSRAGAPVGLAELVYLLGGGQLEHVVRPRLDGVELELDERLDQLEVGRDPLAHHARDDLLEGHAHAGHCQVFLEVLKRRFRSSFSDFLQIN